jgi:HAE1 family hydrophobic/amphiphilic exporter-1
MTSATTILAMVPLSISSGAGSELWKPMGIAVIGGLIFSTVVTLVLVPVVYAVFSKHGERNKHLAAYSDFDFMNGDGNGGVKK